MGWFQFRGCVLNIFVCKDWREEKGSLCYEAVMAQKRSSTCLGSIKPFPQDLCGSGSARLVQFMPSQGLGEGTELVWLWHDRKHSDENLEGNSEEKGNKVLLVFLRVTTNTGQHECSGTSIRTLSAVTRS